VLPIMETLLVTMSHQNLVLCVFSSLHLALTVDSIQSRAFLAQVMSVSGWFSFSSGVAVVMATIVSINGSSTLLFTLPHPSPWVASKSHKALANRAMLFQLFFLLTASLLPLPPPRQVLGQLRPVSSSFINDIA